MSPSPPRLLVFLLKVIRLARPCIGPCENRRADSSNDVCVCLSRCLLPTEWRGVRRPCDVGRGLKRAERRGCGLCANERVRVGVRRSCVSVSCCCSCVSVGLPHADFAVVRVVGVNVDLWVVRVTLAVDRAWEMLDILRTMGE